MKQKWERRIPLTAENRKPRAGSLVVELAMVFPLFALLVFGILEFGPLFSNLLLLQHACQEATQRAAVGATTTELTQTVAQCTALLPDGPVAPVYEWRRWTGSGWTSWVTMGDLNTTNDAPMGAQVRIRLTYVHHLTLPCLFFFLADEPGGSTITLSAVKTSRRE